MVESSFLLYFRAMTKLSLVNNSAQYPKGIEEMSMFCVYGEYMENIALIKDNECYQA